MVYLDLTAAVEEGINKAIQGRMAQLRDHYLTEAAELIRQHRGDLDDDLPWFDTRDRDHAAQILLAARAQQEQGAGR